MTFRFHKSITLLILCSIASFAETKINGFADFQYEGHTDAWKQNGIFLNDGALYLNHTSENAEFVLDLPFSANPTTNDFKFAALKAQAYFKYAASKAVAVQAGQFDVIFGFEASDTQEQHFSAGGLLWTNVMPSTHTGVMGIYTAGPARAKLLVANPDDQGKLNGRNSDIGVQVSYDLRDESVISAGTLLSFESSTTKVIASLMAGFSLLEDLDVDLEFDYVDDPDLEEKTLGYMLHLVQSVSEDLDLGFRIEYLFNGTEEVNTVDIPTHSQFGIAFGPKYSLTDNISLKAEYDLTLLRLHESSSTATRHGMRASAVYKF